MTSSVSKIEILKICASGPKRLSEISRNVSISERNVIENLKKLIKEGLIEKTSRGTYQITESGRTFLKANEPVIKMREQMDKVAEQGSKWEKEIAVLSDFSESELIKLIRGLPKEEAKNITNLEKISHIIEEKNGTLLFTEDGLITVLICSPKIFLDNELWQIFKKRVRYWIGIFIFLKRYRRLIEKYGLNYNYIINEFYNFYQEKLKQICLSEENINVRREKIFDFTIMLPSFNSTIAVAIILSKYIGLDAMFNLLEELFEIFWGDIYADASKK
ncbi:MAG: winged helix DNA-binding protein [Nitrososphaeria archaeon]|nr:winged helix DNA-binding protein [Nitrososphaeria archaeon]